MFRRLKFFLRSGGKQAPSPTYLHQGLDYLHVLEFIHDRLKPRSYLEIGTAAGASLRLASCPSLAIDPNFRLDRDALAWRKKTFLFQMTSDEFFAGYDLRHFIPEGVDLAFLDGLHQYEYLLRDFINTERYAHPHSLIAMHDCYPVNTEITERKFTQNRAVYRTRGWWAGDVWKLLPILRRYRPDLDIKILDSPPTGLILATGLDPTSMVLSEAYDSIVAEFHAVDLDNYGFDRFRREFLLTDSRAYIADAAAASPTTREPAAS